MYGSDNSTITRRRTSRDELTAALEAAGAVIRGRTIRCPFHEDRNPSGSIYERDGIWRYKCFGCDFQGDVWDIEARTKGVAVEELLRAEHERANGGKKHGGAKHSNGQAPAEGTLDELLGRYPEPVEQVHPYRSPEGIELAVVVRFRRANGGKTFRQFSDVGNGRYVAQAPKPPRPLYNLPVIKSHNRLVVVEGEKCVDVIRKFGLPATTSMGGSNGAHLADWSPLAGKQVIIWPDNDPPGRKYARAVASILSNLKPAASVRFLDPQMLGLGDGEDVADYLARHGNGDPKHALLSALATATAETHFQRLRRRVEQIVRGSWRIVELPWPITSRLTNALLPGTCTLICGSVGTAKSFFLLQCMAHWHAEQIPCSILELEESGEYHLARVLSQTVPDCRILDYRWIVKHPEQAKEILNQEQEYAEQLAALIHEPPTEETTQSDVIQWIRARGEAGDRVVGVDPITAAKVEGRQWNEDQRFIAQIEAAAREYGMSIVLITHPTKKGKLVGDLTELAGGASYSRFVQTILWINKSATWKPVTVCTDVGSRVVPQNESDESDWPNAEVFLAKTRSARGQGLKLAFNFNPTTCRFRELGVVKKG